MRNELLLQRIERIARDMEPASAELLAERVLQSRQDWKFLLPLGELPCLLAELAPEHCVLWAGAAVLARYDTQYFDTADRALFHDHRRGRPRRYKVRSRTYPDRHLTMLEVKHKHPSGTDKQRMPRAFRQHDLDDAGSAFVRSHSPLRPEALHETVSNGFRRLTLLGRTCAQRITFDVDLEFWEGDCHQRLDRVVVAEVKSALGRAHTPALRAFAARGLRPQSMSKYCVGTALLHPEIRANPFQPVLQVIRRMEAA